MGDLQYQLVSLFINSMFTLVLCETSLATFYSPFAETCLDRTKHVVSPKEILQVCGLNSRIWMPRTKSSGRRWTASIAWCRTGFENCVYHKLTGWSWDGGCFAPFVTAEIWIFMDVGFWDPLFVNLHACAFADQSISVHSSRWFCYLCHKCLDPTCLWWISTTSPDHLVLPQGRIWSKPKRSAIQHISTTGFNSDSTAWCLKRSLFAWFWAWSLGSHILKRSSPLPMVIFSSMRTVCSCLKRPGTSRWLPS